MPAFTKSSALVLLALALNGFAAPLNGRAAKISKAKDGSTIIDDTVTINGLDMRFKISAPASELVGANGKRAAVGTLGVNVLFHGDGGQSFFDFPNQGVNGNLMGVALLAPNKELRWGGEDPKDNTGLVRPDGPAHSAAVNEFLTKVLPTKVNFDNKKILLEGVSGGSLLLSGFMIPQFAASLGVPGAVLGCGGLEPQVDVQGDISGLRLHFQSTQNDLSVLKQSIPKAILAYEKLSNPNTTLAENGAPLVTADASPNGGHCEFDEKDFVSGVQLLTDNFLNILNGDSGVAHSVEGNENIYDPKQAQAAIASAKAAQAQASVALQNSKNKAAAASNSASESTTTSSADDSTITSVVGESTVTTTNAQGKTVVKVFKTVSVEKASETSTAVDSKATNNNNDKETVTVTKEITKTVTIDSKATSTSSADKESSTSSADKESSTSSADKESSTSSEDKSSSTSSSSSAKATSGSDVKVIKFGRDAA